MDSKMLRYVLKRSLLAVFTIILIITITFFVMHVVPSSPFNKQKALTESVKKALEAKYGFSNMCSIWAMCSSWTLATP